MSPYSQQIFLYNKYNPKQAQIKHSISSFLPYTSSFMLSSSASTIVSTTFVAFSCTSLGA